jgi:hypothetical protein
MVAVPRLRGALLAFLLLPLVTSAHAQDQTVTGTGSAGFSPVTNWSTGSRGYQITLQSHTWSDPANPLPGLQSFASAVYGNEWVMVAGRTNGMHDFTPSGEANFPPNRQNVDVYVVNPVTQQTWRRSLADGTSLSVDQLSRLSATSTQSFQRGDLENGERPGAPGLRPELPRPLHRLLQRHLHVPGPQLHGGLHAWQ